MPEAFFLEAEGSCLGTSSNLRLRVFILATTLRPLHCSKSDSRDSRTTSSVPLECLINLCPPATSSVYRSSPLFPKSKARQRWDMVSSVFFFSNCKLDTASHLDVTKRIRQSFSWLSTPVRPSILICLLPSVVGSARSQPECKISPRLRSFC